MFELFTPFMMFVYSVALVIGIGVSTRGDGGKLAVTTLSIGLCLFFILMLVEGNAELCKGSEFAEPCIKHRIEHYRLIAVCCFAMLGIILEYCIERFMASHAPQS